MSIEKCFCHLATRDGTRYAVKDATARKDLELHTLAIAEHTAQLEALGESVTGHTGELEAHGAEIDAIKENLKGVTTSENLETLTTTVEGHSETLANHKSRLDTYANTLSAHTARLAQLENNISDAVFTSMTGSGNSYSYAGNITISETVVYYLVSVGVEAVDGMYYETFIVPHAMTDDYPTRFQKSGLQAGSNYFTVSGLIVCEQPSKQDYITINVTTNSTPYSAPRLVVSAFHGA